ncbi:MAG: acetolactate synthase small subunit [Acidimicrobiales bacterium]
MTRPGDLQHRTLAVLVEDKAGVLARVADLFARRGYNIVSLAVAPTGNDQFSRITIVVDVESAPLEQIVKQLFKLVNVVEILELAPEAAVERELIMVTVDTSPVTEGGRSRRSEVMELVDIFKGRILAVGTEALTVSLEGTPEKVDDFEKLISDFGILEIQRSGRIALTKLGVDAPRLRA